MCLANTISEPSTLLLHLFCMGVFHAASYLAAIQFEFCWNRRSSVSAFTSHDMILKRNEGMSIKVA